MKKSIVFMIAFSVTFFSPRNFIFESFQHWLPSRTQEETVVQTRELALAKKEPFLPDHALIDVPLLNQLDKPQLKNGCEVTSLAMILIHNGVLVTKNRLADEIKKVPLNYPNNQKGNPNVGFVGDMEVGPGLSVYNGPIFELAQQYVGEKAVNLTNSPFDDLLRKVARGIPVWVITTVDFAPGAKFQPWDTPQGEINVTMNGHSAVITGFDKDYIYVNDPYGYKNRKVDRKAFIEAWKEMGKQAIAIEK